MQVYPAIDLRAGKAVRLAQGDYARETVFGDDPVATAKTWADQGATFLHLVDLDGAKEGKPVNGEWIQKIAASTGLPCQVGGGIRSEDDIRQVLNWGAARIILGTRALQDPAWVRLMAQTFPDRIVIGIDAREGMVATHGWLETSSQTVIDVARGFIGLPLAGVVFTDIARDGMMNGPNIGELVELAQAVPIPVIASGGVCEEEHVRQLRHWNMAGCIIGRALYENSLSLPRVLAIAAGRDPDQEPPA